MSATLATLRDGVTEAWAELQAAHAALCKSKTPATLERFDKAFAQHRLAFLAYDGELAERQRLEMRR